MCNFPNIFDGVEVSCRECDECLATYKNTWVARSVAQMQTHPHTLCVTFTYADWHGQPPLGARVFRYKDIQDFWKLLRYYANERWPDEDVDIKYVIVGEKGSRFGRCHYHGVIFSTHPIAELGEFEGARSKGFALKRRLNWSLWDRGFVEFQQADRDGIAYVLKYILKGRMNAKRSQGHHREGKTEWLASSYLWCSKVPAIGAFWLWQHLKDMTKKGLARLVSAFGFPMAATGTSRANYKKTCVCLSETQMKTIEPNEVETSPDFVFYSNL